MADRDEIGDALRDLAARNRGTLGSMATAVIACDGGIVRCSCGRCGETLASVPLSAFTRGEMDVPRYCGRCGSRVRVEEE